MRAEETSFQLKGALGHSGVFEKLLFAAESDMPDGMSRFMHEDASHAERVSIFSLNIFAVPGQCLVCLRADGDLGYPHT